VKKNELLQFCSKSQANHMIISARGARRVSNSWRLFDDAVINYWWEVHRNISNSSLKTELESKQDHRTIRYLTKSVKRSKYHACIYFIISGFNQLERYQRMKNQTRFYSKRTVKETMIT